MKASKGFTLIELMIAVAIVGVLAAIAVPAYHAYVARSQVVEGLSLAKPIKDEVAQAYIANGSWPADLSAIALDNDSPPSGIYVKSVQVQAGELVITFSSRASSFIAGQTLIIAPGATDDGVILWQCGRASQASTVPVTWVADASAATTLDSVYLPSSCRS